MSGNVLVILIKAIFYLNVLACQELSMINDSS
jgi:hypothetical protein